MNIIIVDKRKYTRSSETNGILYFKGLYIIFIYDILHISYRLHCTMSAAAAKSLQSCLTLCDPIDGNPPGSPVPGILQARTLEWVAICFSNAWKWKMKGKLLSHVQLFATTWTAPYQAPPSMGFSRQEYWGGVPSPSPAHSSSQIYLTLRQRGSCVDLCNE